MMNRFGISTMVYKRVPVFHTWAKNVKQTFGDIPVSVAYSEDYYKDIIESYGFIAVKSPNDPLGSKANDSVEALKGLCEYVITTGSDDLFSKNMPEVYEKHTKYDYFGFLDCYFYSPEVDKSTYWKGYRGRRENEPIGAGKMISAGILDRINWRPFKDTLSRSLDYYYTEKVEGITSNVKYILLGNNKKSFIVDLKTVDNINSFDKILKHTDRCGNDWIKYTHYDTPNSDNT